MFRWLGFGIAVVALVLAACGRQFTGLGAPDAGSILPGHMLIRFRVAGQLNFQKFGYFIVFDTKGNGMEPYPAGLVSGFGNFSFAFVVGANPYSGGLSLSGPSLYQYYIAPGSSGIGDHWLPIPPQDMVYIPDSGANPLGGGEFTIDFDRRLLYAPDPTGLPTPVATTAPATPSATPVAGPTPTPGFTPNPNVQPTSIPQHTWAINFITTSTQGTPLDSMGIGGPTDVTFNDAFVDTTMVYHKSWTKPNGTGTVSDSSAQLYGFEIINAP